MLAVISNYNSNFADLHSADDGLNTIFKYKDKLIS